MNALDKALNAFDIDTHMKYTGTKNIFRELSKELGDNYKSMSDEELKTKANEYINKKATSEAKEDKSSRINNLKPQYRGKLIYAQSGTGKSTIADNKTVFDSDYILGNILGVSPETAGFFFKTLSSKQKKAFGEQYRNAIKQMVANDYTVLTANESLLKDADVVVYNMSPEQTDERVNSDDRAITNRYSDIDYHKSTLEQINKVKEENEEKEYIELDKEDYLGNHILSSSNSNGNRTSNTGFNNRNVQRSLLEGKAGVDRSGRLTSDKIVHDFLDAFGISVNFIDDYRGDLPLFDAHNRVMMLSSEAVDLFGDTTTETQSSNRPTISPQKAKLVQQLEYVAVTRATDTVTIISNDVKKEGSPLHPEASMTLKSDEHKEAVKSNSNTINSTPQRSDNEITKQVVEHLKSIPGIKVLGRDAMEEFLKTHNIEGLQQARAFSESFPYHNSQKASESERREIKDIIRQKKYNKSGSDIVTLDSNGNKTLYLIDHSSHDSFLSNEKEDSKNGVENDLFGIRKVYNIDKISSDDIREITRSIAGDYKNSETAIRNWLQRLGITSGNLPGIDITAAIKRGIRDNDQVDVKTRGFGEQTNKNRGSFDSRKNKGILPFLTPQGEVYGFVDKEGNIYLDETKISPEHPIHEYTHLWDRTVQKHNPRLWNRGIELMKQTSLWNDVLNDEHYGKQWQSMNLSKERLENLIASEVHARIVGENGEKLLGNLAKRKGQNGIISKLKQWILDMWKEVKSTFGSWSKEGLDALTLKDFNHMNVRDFVDGTNLKEINNTKNNGTEEYKTTDEFRRVQETSHKFSEKGVSSFQRGERKLDNKEKIRTKENRKTA